MPKKELKSEKEKIPMIENKKIDDELRKNPEILEKFNRDHGAILVELRGRFQTFLTSGDVIGRYLLTRALFETIQIQGEVAKQHIQERIAEQGVFIHNGSGTSC